MSSRTEDPDSQSNEPTKVGWLSRLWAGLLSLAFPGLGQVFRGAYRRGFVCAVIVAVAVAVVRWSAYAWPHLPALLLYAAIVAAALAVPIIIIFAAIDAFRFKSNRPARFRRRWQRYVTYLAVIAVVSLREVTLGPLHWQTFAIPSTSMEPTLLVGDLIFVVDDYYDARRPQRGDIVVFPLTCDFPLLDPSHAAVYRRSCDTSVYFIKRIVGLPGDQVQLKDGVLFINDEPVRRESAGTYIFTGNGWPETLQKYRETLGSGRSYEAALSSEIGELDNIGVFTVPPKHYFVLGDNRDNSVDTREATGGVGFVPEKNLFARPAFVIFSTNGSAHWWQVWKWPRAIRWNRLGLALQ